MFLKKEKEKNHHPASEAKPTSAARRSLDFTSRHVCIVAALRTSGYAVVHGTFSRQIVRAAA